MRNTVIIGLFFLIYSLCSDAVPAYPHKIPISIDGKTVYVRLLGDEHCKRAESTDGYTLFHSKDNWYYAEKDDEGRLIASRFKLTAEKNQELKEFLKGIPLHLTADRINPSDASKTSGYIPKRKVAAVGNRKILIILMQYTDVEFVKSQNDFDNLFNSPGYREDGAMGSVMDYYFDVSYGQLQLSCDIVGPFTSRHNRAYYGKNDRNGNDQSPVSLFEEAMDNASKIVNLRDYDADEDGYIDNVHIVFAGYGEEAGATSDAIWSHECTFRQPYTFQDMKIDRYSCAPELRGNKGNGISRIGPHCHEIGHALGAMDFYDTNYEQGGYFEGTGDWDIMASGSWNEDGVIPADFNPYVKMYNFGWVVIPELPQGKVIIQPSCNSDSSYFCLSNSVDDYYLIENRTKEKWGEGLPGSGLLVFHIHPNIASSGNEINTTYPQKCYPVCASSNYSIPSNASSSYGSISSDGCPFPGRAENSAFTASTTPAAFVWDGTRSHISINEITLNEDGSISLNNRSSSSDIADGSILLQEGFENSGNYQVIIEEGVTKWTPFSNKIVKTDDGTITPHSGENYLRLMPSKVSFGRQRSQVTLNTSIAKEENEGILTFYYYATSYRPEEDMLYVTYKCDDGELSDTIWVRSTRTGWNSFMQDLPLAKSYQVIISGKATYGQSICLDDVEVVQRTTTRIETTNSDANYQLQLYDFLGNRISSPRRGLYIVRQKDGTSKKLFVR